MMPGESRNLMRSFDSSVPASLRMTIAGFVINIALLLKASSCEKGVSMPRGDQISRQWKILQLLEARRKGVTVPELAAELEANVRTVYRDMEALETAGFPIYSEKDEGDAERWFFVEGYRSKMPIPFALTELMALTIAHDHLKAFEGTAFSESLGEAFKKVRSMLGPESLVFIDSLAQKFKVGVTGARDYRKHRDTIDTVNRAVLDHRTVRIRYRSGKGEALERRIDPYHVWFMGGTIYVVAHCHERGQIRMFVLDRIEQAALTDDIFQLPADFNMEDFTKGRFRVMDGESTDVEIRFDKKVAYYVKERRWHPTQEITEEADGGATLAMTVEGLAEVKSWVLSFGSLAEVITPKELRKELATEHTAAAEKYNA